MKFFAALALFLVSAASAVAAEAESAEPIDMADFSFLEMGADPTNPMVADRVIQQCLANHEEYTELMWQDFVARQGVGHVLLRLAHTEQGE